MKSFRKKAGDDAATDPVTTIQPDAPSSDTSAILKEQSTLDASPADTAQAAGDGSGSRLQKIKHFLLHKKKLSIPLIGMLLFGLLMAVPVTRYALVGTVVQRDFAIVVLDETTKKPVTNATVQLAGKTATTDSKGMVRIKVPVGQKDFSVTKKYYRTNSSTVLVPLNTTNGPFRVFVTATGRQVPVAVTNKITGKPLADVTVSAEGTEVKTDKQGKAVIVLPAGKETIKAKVSGNGYNAQDVTIKVSEQELKENSFSVTPSGKVFFLSRLSGKIDVVKTNLDGTERETVLAGTGKEEQGDNVLWASQDWKYLALKARRDGDLAKLYLIDTTNDKLTTMDEGDANFSPVGWSGHRFVYQVYRNKVPNWVPKAAALKSFDAQTGKMAVIDETEAEGQAEWNYAKSSFSQVSIFDNGELVYGKNWNGNYAYYIFPQLQTSVTGRQAQLISAKVDGSGKKVIKSFAVPTGTTYFTMNPVLYAPGEVYLQVPGFHGEKNTYYQYENGKITAVDMMDEQFHRGYPTYLESPSGKKTFWSEQRDGKNVLFVGNGAGENEKQVAALSEYNQYGWYTDEYILVSKNYSELYIMPADGGTPFKVADYHAAGGGMRRHGGH